MNNFYATCNQLANSTIEILTDAVQKGGVLGGRAVEYVKALPEQMHQDSNTAVMTFLVANLAFLGIATLFSRFIENLSDRSDGSRFGLSHNSFKNIAIRLIVIGGAVAGSNLLLSRITEYALDNFALAVITGSQVGLSLLMKLSSSSNNKSENKAEEKAAADRARREKAKAIEPPNFKFQIFKPAIGQTQFIITCENETDLNNFFEKLVWGTFIESFCILEKKSTQFQIILKMKIDKDTVENQKTIERNLKNYQEKLATPNKSDK